jgi:hypothetical protein
MIRIPMETNRIFIRQGIRISDRQEGDLECYLLYERITLGYGM